MSTTRPDSGRTSCRSSISIRPTSIAASTSPRSSRPTGRSDARRRRPTSLGRTPRRDAVREGVAAHAHRRSRSRFTSSAGRCVDARSRTPRSAAASRSPTSRAISSDGSTRSSSGRSRSGCSGIRGGGAAAARHQRAHRRRAPVPGARRLPDASRALGHRCAAGRSPTSATATTSRCRSPMPRPCSARTARRQPRGLPAAARGRAAGDERRAARRPAAPLHRRRPMPWPAPTRSTPTPGRRWARKPKPTVRRRDLRAVPGQRRPDGARQAGRALHALPARASRRRGHRRRLRVARIGRLRSGREPPALPEGAAPDAARARERVAAAGGAKPTLKASAYNV